MGRKSYDWRDTVRANVAALPQPPRGRAASGIFVSFIGGGLSLLREAARARGMSPTGYARRAIYAMACFDLEIPVKEAFLRDPRVTRETGLGVVDPDGTGFGPWQITGLEGEVRDATGA